MVRATVLYPLAQYTIKHPLTHQVALETQLSDARALCWRMLSIF